MNGAAGANLATLQRGAFTLRLLLYVPPVKVPPTCSVVEPLGAPLKVTVFTDEAPGASVLT